VDGHAGLVMRSLAPSLPPSLPRSLAPSLPTPFFVLHVPKTKGKHPRVCESFIRPHTWRTD
jgi:hypothetical protein